MPLAQSTQLELPDRRRFQRNHTGHGRTTGWTLPNDPNRPPAFRFAPGCDGLNVGVGHLEPWRGDRTAIRCDKLRTASIYRIGGWREEEPGSPGSRSPAVTPC